MNPKQALKIEALLDAVGWLNSAFDDPTSLAYRLKNPALVRSYSQPGKHETDENGVRVFTSHLAGYKACLYDFEKKLTGTSRARLEVTDPLSAFFSVYGITEPAGHKKLILFIRKALNDESIAASTTLAEFIQ